LGTPVDLASRPYNKRSYVDTMVPDKFSIADCDDVRQLKHMGLPTLAVSKRKYVTMLLRNIQ